MQPKIFFKLLDISDDARQWVIEFIVKRQRSEKMQPSAGWRNKQKRGDKN